MKRQTKHSCLKEKEWNLTVWKLKKAYTDHEGQSPQHCITKSPSPAYEGELHPGPPTLHEVFSSDLLFNSRRKGGFLPVQRKCIMKPHVAVGSQVKSR